MNFKITPFDESKHIHLLEELTELLHEAYRPLAEKGLKYVATHQPSDVTLRRLNNGHSFLGFIDDELVSTITLVFHRPKERCDYYKNPEVCFFTQFAVKPKYQGHGFGKEIMSFIESYAKTKEVKELALDTSVHAVDLISMYEKLNYRKVGKMDWPDTNYKSVILSKIVNGEQRL